MNVSKNNPAFNICLMAIGVAIISVLAQISIPLPFGVPLTMQTFAVIFVAYVLGAKRGIIAVFIYVAVGAIGVPVYANFTGGIGILVSPPGGFLLSFPLLALLAGLGMELGLRKNGAIRWVIIAVCTYAGVCVNYAIGTLVFSVVTNTGFLASLAYCVVPFIAVDAVKVAVAIIAASQVRLRIKAFA